MKLSPVKINSFQTFIWHFYQNHGRQFAWRNIDDPYKIVVSEIMLQQTQTYRVEPKYDHFVATFGNFQSLAAASLRDVLSVWQGLGYNRRGRFLHQIAQKIVADFNGILPDSPDILQTLPGIGKATAASICAFAFNKPVIFIETNIRAVFINSFFPDKSSVHDKEIFPLIEATLETNSPREWYYALMDYGVMLKKNMPNPSRKSAHYAKQSRFEGSDRQIRGMVIKLLVEKEALTLSAIKKIIKKKSVRIEKIVAQLCAEGFLRKDSDHFLIK